MDNIEAIPSTEITKKRCADDAVGFEYLYANTNIEWSKKTIKYFLKKQPKRTK